MRRDPHCLTDECEYFDPPTELQQIAARKTVCSQAENAEDAAMLLRMLGLHPNEPVDSGLPVSLESLGNVSF